MIEVKAGFGKSDITPRIGVKLAGFASDKRAAAGVHDKLFARVICIEVSKKRICIIQTDLVGFDEGCVEAVKDYIAPLGFEKENIFIGATHTHSGPKGTRMRNQSDKSYVDAAFGAFDESLFEQYKEAIAKSVDVAVKSLCKCEIRFGLTEVANVCTNRNDSSISCDQMLLVLDFKFQNGKTALLYNFASHPTVMNTHNEQISADLPYGVSKILEGKEYDLVMFINGSCGDISTRFTKKSSDFSEIERLGKLLVDGIENALKNSKLLEIVDLKVDSFTTKLKVKDIDSIDDAKKKIEQCRLELEAFSESEVADKNSTKYIRVLESRLEGAGCNLELSQNFNGIYETEIKISILQIGALTFVFVPAELFSKLSNPLRKKYLHKLVFCGYFNGYQGYIADALSYDEGTYEAQSSLYKRGQGEELMKQLELFLEKEFQNFI